MSSTTHHRSRRKSMLLVAAGTLIAPLGVVSAQAADGTTQRPGAVFSMTNNMNANSITVFARSTD